MSDDDRPDDDPDSDGSPRGPRPMTPLAAAGWAFTATFLMLLVVSFLQGIRPSAQLSEVSAVGGQAVGYLVTLFLILRLHAPDAGVRDFVGMRPTNALALPLSVGLGLALYAPADALFTVILRRFPVEDHLAETFHGSSPAMRVGMALAVILVGPMLEEIIFRGAIFRPLIRRYEPSLVISVTAILFALAHLTPQTWLPVALLGVVLGFVRRETGSLVPSMLIHATFNAVPFYRMASMPPDAPDPGMYPLWLIAGSVVVAAALLVGFALIGRTSSARLAQEYDKL